MSNSLMFLLILMVGGVLIATLFYYGGQLLVRLPNTAAPAKVAADIQTVAVRKDSTPDTSSQDQINAASQQPAVIRVLPLHESGIPYASRST